MRYDVGNVGSLKKFFESQGHCRSDDVDAQSVVAASPHDWLALALTVAIVLFLYLPICSYGFSIVDDAANIYGNKFICHVHAQNILHFWRHPYYDLYMPVTDTIWALLARIAPLRTPVVLLCDGEPSSINPAVFHAASVLLHVATTALIFLILRRLHFRPWGCAAGALLFGVHPLQVESVAWITGMNNLTSGFFGFFAIYLYVREATQLDKPSRQSLASYVWIGVATLAYCLALLSKPLATIVPLFLIVIEMIVLRRPIRRWAAIICIWLLLSLACVVVARAASSFAAYDTWSPLWGRPFVAGDALSFYIAKLLCPYELTFDYARNPSRVLEHWWGYMTWLLPASLCYALWVFGARHGSEGKLPNWLPALRASFLLFAAGLLPTIGLVPYYSEAISTVSDRYVYLAMFGPALAVAAMLSRPLLPHKLLLAIPIAILGATSLLTALELPIWSNMYSLTNDMLASSPQSAIAHECYGILLGKQDQWDGAYKEFRRAEALESVVSPVVDDSIGQCLFHLKRYDEAIAHYKEAIRLQPDDDDGWFQLWLIYSGLNRLHDAENYVRAYLADHPNDDRAKFTLGLILMQARRPAEALPYVELAAANDPESSDDQYYVGVVNQQLGRFAVAAEHYHAALSLDAQNADAVKALASLPSQK